MKKQIKLENATYGEVASIVSEFKKERPNLKIRFDKNIISIVYHDNDTHDDDYQSLYNILKNYHHISIKEEVVLPTIRRVLYLHGMDCPNCAAKIERISKRTFDYEQIIVDFATERFIIETTDKELIDNLIPMLQKITMKVDTAIKVKTKAEYIVDKQSSKIPKK